MKDENHKEDINFAFFVGGLVGFGLGIAAAVSVATLNTNAYETDFRKKNG